MPEASSSSSFPFTTKLLLVIVLLQWGVATVYLIKINKNVVASYQSKDILLQAPLRIQRKASDTSSTGTVDDVQWKGVALGLMLRRPKWYLKRYNQLIHNAVSNIPADWALQLMISETWFYNELLPFHRGLGRLIFNQTNPRIIVTPLPDHLATKKPNIVWSDRWVWEHVKAETVATFHGDGVFCANSAVWFDHFADIDYVGVPWGLYDGLGGDGTTHSIRRRSATLAALDYYEANKRLSKPRRQDAMIVSALLDLNKNYGGSYKIATMDDTIKFGGTDNLMVHDGNTTKLAGDTAWGPMVITGTLASLPQEARDWALGTCPELKAIFPSLHNPACFGARPDPVQCAISLELPPPCSGIAKDMATER